MFANHKKAIVSICLIAVLLAGSVCALFFGKKCVEKFFWVIDVITLLSEEMDARISKLEQVTKAMDLTFNYSFDYTWTEEVPPLIAHAFGGIEDAVYTNSLEAFYHNYNLGHRVFEVDFFLTTPPENTLVATHDEGDWHTQIGEVIPMNYTNFMGKKLYGSYTALDYAGVIDLMIEYPDIYIITDMKLIDKASVYLQFSQLVRYAESKDPSVLDRMIPQVYHEDMLDWVMDVHTFKSAILSLYQIYWTPESVCEISRNTGIKYITVEYTRLTPEIATLWKEAGLSIACHTLNNPVQAQEAFSMGVDYIYTDFLTPSQIE